MPWQVSLELVLELPPGNSRGAPYPLLGRGTSPPLPTLPSPGFYRPAFPTTLLSPPGPLRCLCPPADILRPRGAGRCTVPPGPLHCLCPPLQIYSVLEEQADALSRQAGHGAYIFEAAATNTRKMTSFMV